MYQVSGVTVERIITDGQAILIEAVSRAATGLCPLCQQQSEQVHSRYHRSLADLPACGRPVRVRLAVRRFRCRVLTCPKQTFAEQIPTVTHPIANGWSGWNRCSPRLAWPSAVSGRAAYPTDRGDGQRVIPPPPGTPE